MTYETFQDSVVYIHGICEDNTHGEHGLGFVYKIYQDYTILVTSKHALIHNKTKTIRDQNLIESFHWDDNAFMELCNPKRMNFMFGKKSPIEIIKHIPSLDTDISFLLIDTSTLLKPFETKSTISKECYCLKNTCSGVERHAGILLPKTTYHITGREDIDQDFIGHYYEDQDCNIEDKEYLHVASFKKSGVGMSGGPLINNNKELLGMIVASDNDVKSKKQIALYYTIETIDKVYSNIKDKIEIIGLHMISFFIKEKSGSIRPTL